MNTIPAYTSTSHLYASPLHALGSRTSNSHVAVGVPRADPIPHSLIDLSLTALGANYARSHSIYPTQTAPIHHLQERLHAAEFELAKVTGQRDTLRAVLSKLADKLSITSGEIVDFGPLELPSSTPQPQPTRESHPNIQFWKKADYMAWKGTAAAVQRNKLRGKLPYLEDAKGNWLDDETVKLVWKLLHVGLNDLFSRGIAPKKWGQATPGAIAYIKKLLERAHPLFTFEEHRWKLDHFIITHYPFWAWRKFGKADGDEELDNADNLSDIDTNDTVDPSTSPSSGVPGLPKKRKTSSPSSAAPRPLKKHKASPPPSAIHGSSDEVNHNLACISTLPDDTLCQPKTKREEFLGDTSAHSQLQDLAMCLVTELDLPTDTSSTQLSEAPVPTQSIAKLDLPTDTTRTQLSWGPVAAELIAKLTLPMDTSSAQLSGAPVPLRSIAELNLPTDTSSMQLSGAQAPIQSIVNLPMESIASMESVTTACSTIDSEAGNIMIDIDPLSLGALKGPGVTIPPLPPMPDKEAIKPKLLIKLNMAAAE